MSQLVKAMIVKTISTKLKAVCELYRLLYSDTPALLVIYTFYLLLLDQTSLQTLHSSLNHLQTNIHISTNIQPFSLNTSSSSSKSQK